MNPTNTYSCYDALLQICQHRSSTRSFSARPLLMKDIEKIRSIAMTSPYASGKKNWELNIITDGCLIKKMSQAVQDHVEQMKAQVREDLIDEFMNYAKNFHAFNEAPALFVPTFRIAPSLSLMVSEDQQGIRDWERDNYVKSISCVSMLVLLAAESLKLAACYMTGPLIAEKALGPLFGMKPGRNIAALIPVGYPKENKDGHYRD